MSVADAALMMNVLKRPDARDWTSLPPDPSDYTIGLDDGIRGLAHRLLADARLCEPCTPRSPPRSMRRSRELTALGAHVEPVDPGFDDPLEITTGLWFVGAWTLWNTLTPEQQAVTDPDLRCRGDARLATAAALDVQRLHAAPRRRWARRCASSCSATTCSSRRRWRCRRSTRAPPATAR